jgi:hypothetical protein
MLLIQQARAWDPTPYIKTSDESTDNSSSSTSSIGCKLPPVCSAKGVYDPVKRMHVRTVVHNHDKLYARHCHSTKTASTANKTATATTTATGSTHGAVVVDGATEVSVTACNNASHVIYQCHVVS